VEIQDDRPDEEIVIKQRRSEDKTGVYDALDALEKAIRIENPYLKLKGMEYQQVVDHIEQNKYPLLPNVIKHIIVPLIYSWLLCIFSSTKLVRWTWRLMDVHFWTIVVWAPILFLRLKRSYEIIEPSPFPIKDKDGNYDVDLGLCVEMTGLSPQFDWNDPVRSCKDYTLVLSEYWSSAVRGMAAVPVLRAFLLMLYGKSIVRSGVLPFWLTCSQFLTRIAAVASLYQYPEMMFLLQRHGQPRPVAMFPNFLQILVRSMLYLAPIGLISDFSKVLTVMPEGWIYPLYACIAVVLYGTWTRMNETTSNDPDNFHEIQPPNRITRRIYWLCFVALWRKQLLSLGLLLIRTLKSSMGKVTFSAVAATNDSICKLILCGCVMSIPVVGPLIHLKAISRIVKITYSNSLPAIISSKSDEKTMKDLMKRREWIYSLSWREPERLSVVQKRLEDDLVYNAWVKGGNEDKRQNSLAASIPPQRHEDRSLLGMVRRDLELDPDTFSKEPPATGKARAMKLQEELHRSNYEANTIEDPLGTALWKGFGIGLGMSHFSKKYELKNGETPSARLLQIDAAERAVARYNQLRDTEIFMQEREKDMDPGIRSRRQKAREEADQQEIQYIAKKLVELIPCSGDSRLFDDDIFKFLGKERTFEKISDHEVLIVEVDVDESNLSSRQRRAKKSYEDRAKRHWQNNIEISPSVQKIVGEIGHEEGNQNSAEVGGSDDGEDKSDGVDGRDDDFDDWEPEIVFV
jgi:hypothetical protein